MKKTFDDVTIKDKLYIVDENHWEYRELKIKSIDQKMIYCYNSYIVERSIVLTRKRENHSTQYRTAEIIFSTEVEAIRYCKSFLMSNLQRLIEKAKEAIQNVKKLRADNYEKLNKEWLETTIQEMEAKVR